MPYRTLQELPEAQVTRSNRYQRQALLEAVHHAYEQYGGDERIAVAVAHTAAKRAGEKHTGGNG